MNSVIFSTLKIEYLYSQITSVLNILSISFLIIYFNNETIDQLKKTIIDRMTKYDLNLSTTAHHL